jgi:para-aminobenzoate synthetase / 4-amino-4-deoxychorismate lyase
MNGGDEPYVRFDSFDGRGRSWELATPLGVIEARRHSEVEPALRAVQDAVAGGAFAGGFVAYEAAPGLEDALTARRPRDDLPLLWFGLFAERREGIPPLAPAAPSEAMIGAWRPALEPGPYAQRVEAIRELIAAGDTYQVNLTFPLHAAGAGSQLELYATLGRAQQAGYCALLRLPGHTILSISPELFFGWSGGVLEMRPMKGTRPRGRWAAEDRALAAELHGSEKDRAENLMIVDLLRNDAGRVAQFGSVEVVRLFEVESYPTVHQLTSTLRARTRPGTTLLDLFRALFPSGSVTGAPKVRTMQIIADLEQRPRGVYAGAVGIVSADEAVFNVPIRTLLLSQDGQVEMSVGSGITYDSRPAAEYQECLQKAAFTRLTPRSFSLLETMLYEPARGLVLLDRHIARLSASAAYFGYPLDPAMAVQAVEGALAGAGEPRRVRLLLSPEGNLTVELAPLADTSEPLQARIALARVNSADPFLFHKTTLRAPYEERLAERPGFDEVLLVNERGELTEFANGNLVVRIDGVSWTPPLDCGLLPGVLREELIERGELRERVLRAEELQGAEAIYRINSVRGWTRVELGRGGEDSSQRREDAK